MYFDFENISNELDAFLGAKPFDHCIVDGFFEDEVAKALSNEFPDYSSSDWYVYNNKIEHKKALNNWNIFPKNTYSVFCALNSRDFINLLSEKLGVQLYPDPGLHGGGWHIHGNGGNLNPHFDYSIHPKMGLQRRVNIIVYLGQGLEERHGGHLGLWEHDESSFSPGELAKEVAPVFNRAVIFDTTQNSWHGMSRKLNCPEGVFRKSLAIYYLCEPSESALKHERALFAPRESQKGDEGVSELIRKRSDVSLSEHVYRLNKGEE